MKFDVKEFKATITKLLPYSGTVNRISLHLNGAIEMRCEDIDYGKECAYKMTYISKEFPDMTIHLNGKLLLNALKIFKDKEIKMYSDGGSSRAITLTNGNETALVMPIFPNNSY